MKNEEGKVSKLFPPCHIDKDSNEGATDEEKNYPRLKKKKKPSFVHQAGPVHQAGLIQQASIVLQANFVIQTNDDGTH